MGKGSPGSALDPVVAGSMGQPVMSRSWVDLGRVRKGMVPQGCVSVAALTPTFSSRAAVIPLLLSSFPKPECTWIDRSRDGLKQKGLWL